MNGRAQGPRHVFLDLENLAFLATNLHHLSMRLRMESIEFRAYTAPEHDWADRATHLAKSNEKEAADVRMVVDASMILAKNPRAEILLITDDQFGHTLGAEEQNVSHVTWSGMLPGKWLRWLRWVDIHSVEEFFGKFEIYKERQSRPESRAGSVSRGRSASRGRSDAGSSRAVSPIQEDGECSYGSFSRASWSRAPRSRVGFGSLNGDEPVRRTRRQTQGRVAELESKLETEQKKAAAMERSLRDANEYTQKRARELAKKQLEDYETQLAQTQAMLQEERRRAPSQGVVERNVLAGAQFPSLPVGKAPARTGDTATGVPQPRPILPPRKWPQGVEPTEGKIVGKVVYYNPDRAFGFILPFKNGAKLGDVFMHRSSISCEGELNESLKHWDLEFTLGRCHKTGRLKAHAVSGPGGRYIPDLSHGLPSESNSTPRHANGKGDGRAGDGKGGYGKGKGGRGDGRGLGGAGAKGAGKGGRGRALPGFIPTRYG